MNLAICLLMTQRYLEKARIREVVEGYAGLSDAAFERTFERDKDDLRMMGVPVETGSNSVLFPDEIGYRIRRTAFELPPIDFTSAETAALGLATRVWESATRADQAISALAKLRAAGVEPDPARIRGLEPSMSAREPGFDPLWQATMSRTAVLFDYRGEARRVQPWAMTYRRGAWYLLGHDQVRHAPRVFKVARIAGEVRTVGRSGAYDVPAVDMAALLATIEPAAPDADAVVAIRHDAAPAIRRRGEPVTDPPDVPPGFTAYRVSYASQGDFAGEVCAHGPDVLVLAPTELRDAVIGQLRAVAGGRR